MEELQVCNCCKVNQPISNFGNRTDFKEKKLKVCRDCANIKAEAYRKSKLGLVNYIYHNQRLISKNKGVEPPAYSKQELSDWFYAQPNFEELYTNWEKGGYTKDTKPSVDRLDDSIGYNLNNIRLVSFRENVEKQYDKIRSGEKVTIHKKVNQYDLEGKYLNTYISIAEAKRAVGKKGIDIRGAVLGNIKTSGGFLWREYQDNINDIELVPFIKKEKKLGKAKQKINQYTLDGKFIKCWDTITEAHRTLNIYLRSIRECCQGKVAQAKGFIWKYADETI